MKALFVLFCALVTAAASAQQPPTAPTTPVPADFPAKALTDLQQSKLKEYFYHAQAMQGSAGPCLAQINLARADFATLAQQASSEVQGWLVAQKLDDKWTYDPNTMTLVPKPPAAPAPAKEVKASSPPAPPAAEKK